MKFSHTSERIVEFSETDMAGLVHFTHYFRYAERAEADFFEAVGVPLIESCGDVRSGWPRVRASCKFQSPLYFRDRLAITIAIRALKVRAIDWVFAVYRLENGLRTRVAKGEFSTVFVRVDAAGGGLVPEAIPQRFLDRTCEAPEDFLGNL